MGWLVGWMDRWWVRTNRATTDGVVFALQALGGGGASLSSSTGAVPVARTPVRLRACCMRACVRAPACAGAMVGEGLCLQHGYPFVAFTECDVTFVLVPFRQPHGIIIIIITNSSSSSNNNAINLTPGRCRPGVLLLVLATGPGPLTLRKFDDCNARCVEHAHAHVCVRVMPK